MTRIVMGHGSQCDYYDNDKRMNCHFQLVLPEYILHIVINFLFLISEQYFSLFVNVPLIAYHVWRYMNRPLMTQSGLYDPTSIMNAYDLSMYQREGWVKLAFYLLSFFYYLYGCVVPDCLSFEWDFVWRRRSDWLKFMFQNDQLTDQLGSAEK